MVDLYPCPGNLTDEFYLNQRDLQLISESLLTFLSMALRNRVKSHCLTLSDVIHMFGQKNTTHVRANGYF